MYRDLKDHEQNVLSNPIISKLFNPLEEDSSYKEPEASSQKIVLHNVVDADSSQIEAICASKKGESFVLEGPLELENLKQLPT